MVDFKERKFELKVEERFFEGDDKAGVKRSISYYVYYIEVGGVKVYLMPKTTADKVHLDDVRKGIIG